MKQKSLSDSSLKKPILNHPVLRRPYSPLKSGERAIVDFFDMHRPQHLTSYQLPHTFRSIVCVIRTVFVPFDQISPPDGNTSSLSGFRFMNDGEVRPSLATGPTCPPGPLPAILRPTSRNTARKTASRFFHPARNQSTNSAIAPRWRRSMIATNRSGNKTLLPNDGGWDGRIAKTSKNARPSRRYRPSQILCN